VRRSRALHEFDRTSHNQCEFFDWRFYETFLLSYLGTTLLILITLPALAQSPSTGAQLSGSILDPKGAVVPGATVTLRSDTVGNEQTIVSDGSGQYRFKVCSAVCRRVSAIY
jgi:hypothetical protein